MKTIRYEEVNALVEELKARGYDVTEEDIDGGFRIRGFTEEYGIRDECTRFLGGIVIDHKTQKAEFYVYSIARAIAESEEGMKSHLDTIGEVVGKYI
jgi:hypothetical protein